MNKQYRDERELLHALAGGDERAFDHLFRSYFAATTLFAEGIVKDLSAAEEIAQESFIKLWNARRKLRKVSNLKSYLYTIVRNGCIDWLGQQRRMPTEEVKDMAMDDPTIEELIIRAETTREIHRMISRLSPRMQEVFRLYYLEGKTTTEISELMETSRETVMSQRKTALRFIRKIFIPG